MFTCRLPRGRRPLAAILLTLAIVGLAPSRFAAGDRAMKDTKTYCFGRFLIDLPKAAEVNGQAYEFMFGKIESERFLGGAEGFEKKMKEREAELLRARAEVEYESTRWVTTTKGLVVIPPYGGRRITRQQPDSLR